jgi:type IV pilus biogenesis protein CpaD/CtpE
MIANPQDLLRGRDHSPYDGQVIAVGVTRYETDKIKPIAEITTTTMQTAGAGGGSGGSSGGGATGN